MRLEICGPPYLWCIRSHLGSFRVIAPCKKVVEFAGEELLGTCQVVADGHPKGQVGVLKYVGDVRDDVLFLHTDRQHLKNRFKTINILKEDSWY